MTTTPTDKIKREPEFAVGHYLTLLRPSATPIDLDGDAKNDLVTPQNQPGWTEMRFQNFWINETAIWKDPKENIEQKHLFLPFGFSGVSTNRSGDNVDTSLVFPKNALSLAFTDYAIKESWSVVVRVVWVKNLADSQVSPTLLHRYEGMVAGASWDDTTIVLICNSILDAVEVNVPARSLQQLLVGNVPFTGQLSLK